ncbi:MAG: hypothetical protein WDZ26_06785 [Nitriliruptoraceae bacterium]
MTSPTFEDLELLLELQQTDSAVRRQQYLLDALVEQQQLDACEALIAQLAAERDDVVVDLERAGAQQRQLEREVEILTERRDAEQSRLYDGTISNERQMRSVDAEVESTRRRITEHEELLMEILEKVDGLETRQLELDDRLESERVRVVDLTAARDAAASVILAELAELGVVRDRQAADLPADLLARYEQVVARTGGVAVGRLDGQACSACRVEMPMAEVGDLLAGPPLSTCPQCRRLLVIPA